MNYEIWQKIFVKRNRRLGPKLSKTCTEEIVKENKNSVVITESGRTIHNLVNIYFIVLIKFKQIISSFYKLNENKILKENWQNRNVNLINTKINKFEQVYLLEQVHHYTMYII